MSKLSKKMAHDFKENKKKSLSIASNYTQHFINDQQVKEEYLDRTVYKITKGRSPKKQEPAVVEDGIIFREVNPNNLSVQFDEMDGSFDQKRSVVVEHSSA